MVLLKNTFNIYFQPLNLAVWIEVCHNHCRFCMFFSVMCFFVLVLLFSAKQSDTTLNAIEKRKSLKLINIYFYPSRNIFDQICKFVHVCLKFFYFYVYLIIFNHWWNDFLFLFLKKNILWVINIYLFSVLKSWKLHDFIFYFIFL